MDENDKRLLVEAQIALADLAMAFHMSDSDYRGRVDLAREMLKEIEKSESED